MCPDFQGFWAFYGNGIMTVQAMIFEQFEQVARDQEKTIARLSELRVLGCPIMVGLSRKSFLAGMPGEQDARRRLPGSLAAGLFALDQGAFILRVHDVAETMQAILVWQTLRMAMR